MDLPRSGSETDSSSSLSSRTPGRPKKYGEEPSTSKFRTEVYRQRLAEEGLVRTEVAIPASCHATIRQIADQEGLRLADVAGALLQYGLERHHQWMVANSTGVTSASMPQSAYQSVAGISGSAGVVAGASATVGAAKPAQVSGSIDRTSPVHAAALSRAVGPMNLDASLLGGARGSARPRAMVASASSPTSPTSPTAGHPIPDVSSSPIAAFLRKRKAD
jgi:hypothetical protein